MNQIQRASILYVRHFQNQVMKKNPLVDMYYYSVSYYMDRVSQISQEIEIDNLLKEHLVQYSNF